MTRFQDKDLQDKDSLENLTNKEILRGSTFLTSYSHACSIR